MLLAAGLLCGQSLRVKMPHGVVTMDIEDYVAAALAGEAGGFHSEQALQAMAVAVRTFARVNRGRHRAQGYDYCETTHCQDLRVKGVNGRVRDAARATEGLILWGDGRPARVFYHAHCGGHTEGAGVLWKDSARPWLRGDVDAACGNGKWSARIAAADLGFRELQVTARSPSGRVTRLRHENGMLTAGELHRAVGRTLGWDLLRSTLFHVSKQGDSFLFEGQGRGHGVGLCQTGADARGRAGATWRQILAHYFPGAVVRQPQWQRLRGERIEAELASPNDAWVIGLAEKALSEAERRAGRKCARPPRLRVYATVQAYRDDTGEPGFIAASTRRGLIRLQPLAKLRPELEALLLHEMLHVLVAQDGPPRPLWEEEGRVLRLSGRHCPPAPLAKGTESALASPRNEAELRAAYQNACAATPLGK
jgi:stage II sporulation protein D